MFKVTQWDINENGRQLELGILDEAKVIKMDCCILTLVIFWSCQVFFLTLISWSKNVHFLTTSEVKFHFSWVALGRKHEFLFALMVNRGNAILPDLLGSKVNERVLLKLWNKTKIAIPLGLPNMLATGLKIFIWNSSCLRMLPDLESVLGPWTVSLLSPYTVLWHL